MKSMFYDSAIRRMTGIDWASDDPAGFTRISVRRRTWRTLWLVKRTFRVKVPTVLVSLSTEAEPPAPDPALAKRVWIP